MHNIASAVLRGKRCLITGGSRGIGLAIATAFARAGASCVLVARNQERLDGALKSVRSIEEEAVGGDAQASTAIAGDVGDSEFWKGVVAKEPDVNILVNAAGISNSSLLASTSYEKIDEIIRSNLLGTIYGCKAYMRPMMKQKNGCIINISSVLGIKGGIGDTVYSASKAGIIGHTKSLSLELGRFGVRVNSICPGYIETDMTNSMADTEKQAIKARTPLQRFGKADEVASVALMLATNEFITGSVVTVDGGLTA